MDRIKNLCAHRKVKSIFAFGSVCTDRFSPSSDIDLLIAFEPMDYGDYADNFFFLAEEFERLFQRKVDLITENSLATLLLILPFLPRTASSAAPRPDVSKASSTY
ncbi:MAG: hypothetical protein D3906_04865, partial [Candidatus Electrothrix sp. AUS1_2]|nr:hypothetical protein [Candidatus Electrothrix sp. AUS1_2]